MLPLDPLPPDNKNPAGGETSGAYYKNSNVIFPKKFQGVNKQVQRLQDALANIEMFAAAVERDLNVRYMRKYLNENERH